MKRHLPCRGGTEWVSLVGANGFSLPDDVMIGECVLRIKFEVHESSLEKMKKIESGCSVCADKSIAIVCTHWTSRKSVRLLCLARA